MQLPAERIRKGVVVAPHDQRVYFCAAGCCFGVSLFRNRQDRLVRVTRAALSRECCCCFLLLPRGPPWDVVLALAVPATGRTTATTTRAVTATAIPLLFPASTTRSRRNCLSPGVISCNRGSLSRSSHGDVVTQQPRSGGGGECRSPNVFAKNALKGRGAVGCLLVDLVLRLFCLFLGAGICCLGGGSSPLRGYFRRGYAFVASTTAPPRTRSCNGVVVTAVAVAAVKRLRHPFSRALSLARARLQSPPD